MHRLQQLNEALDTSDLVVIKELDRNTMSLEISEREEDDVTAPRNRDCISFREELWASSDYIFQRKLTWLLLLGPLAIVGDAFGILGEPACFALSGIALIPLAES